MLPDALASALVTLCPDIAVNDGDGNKIGDQPLLIASVAAEVEAFTLAAGGVMAADRVDDCTTGCK